MGKLSRCDRSRKPVDGSRRRAGPQRAIFVRRLVSRIYAFWLTRFIGTFSMDLADIDPKPMKCSVSTGISALHMNGPNRKLIPKKVRCRLEFAVCIRFLLFLEDTWEIFLLQSCRKRITKRIWLLQQFRIFDVFSSRILRAIMLKTDQEMDPMFTSITWKSRRRIRFLTVYNIHMWKKGVPYFHERRPPF